MESCHKWRSVNVSVLCGLWVLHITVRFTIRTDRFRRRTFRPLGAVQKAKKLNLITACHKPPPGSPRVRSSLRSYLNYLVNQCQLQHLKFRINKAMDVYLMTPCRPVGGYRISGGANRLGCIQRNLPPTNNSETNFTLLATFTVTFLHDRHNSFSLITSVSMKMEAEKSYETSVSVYDTTNY